MGGAVANMAWGLIALVAATASLVMAAHGLRLDWSSLEVPALATSALIGLAAYYRLRRADERLATALAATAQIIAFSASAAVLSYAVATFDFPFWDASFMRWDRAMGLDWLAYLAFVNAHPWLARAYSFAYASIMPQFVILTLGLALAGRTAACRGFVLGVVVAGLVTVAVSGFMPAVSVFAYLGLSPGDYPSLDVIAAFAHLAPLHGLRGGTLTVISLTGAEGIITFPSFHAALAVLFGVAFCRLPWARWPGLVLNVTMLASTPLNGGHYFADVFAGVAVALGALAAVHGLGRQAFALPSRLRTRPSPPRPLPLSA